MSSHPPGCHPQPQIDVTVVLQLMRVSTYFGNGPTNSHACGGCSTCKADLARSP